LEVCVFDTFDISPVRNHGHFLWNAFILRLMIATVVSLFYYTLLESAFGITIGKFFTGTKVVMVDGSQPSFKVIIIRTLCLYL